MSYFSSFRLFEVRFYSDSQISSNVENNMISRSNVNLEQNLSSIPEPPTTCCMSGCANCVWIEYAEKLTAYFKDGGDKARKHILDSVTDSNMRAFLMMELRTMNK